MARTLRQIIRDPSRTGVELGLVQIEQLRNQILGEKLIVSDKEISLMEKELSQEERGIFSLYETICRTVLNIYNFSRQTTFKFYTSYNALVTMQDKLAILEVMKKEQGTPATLKSTVLKTCASITELKDKTEDTYNMMFEAISFIEASNAYIRLLLNHFNINGLNCLQFNTDDFYGNIDKLCSQTTKLYETVEADRVGEAREVFPDLSKITKKTFVPEPRKMSEYKEFLRNEPNRVIKNSFSFIMLLQNQVYFKNLKNGEVSDAR